ncbi:hypothetical protein VPH35_008177 [Triticum aestivum]
MGDHWEHMSTPPTSTRQLPVSAAIVGLPQAHDVPIRICIALRPQQHPCPPAPAGSRDPRHIGAATSHVLASLSHLLSLMFGSDVSVMCVGMDMRLSWCVKIIFLVYLSSEY